MVKSLHPAPWTLAITEEIHNKMKVMQNQLKSDVGEIMVKGKNSNKQLLHDLIKLTEQQLDCIDQCHEMMGLKPTVQLDKSVKKLVDDADEDESDNSDEEENNEGHTDDDEEENDEDEDTEDNDDEGNDDEGNDDEENDDDSNDDGNDDANNGDGSNEDDKYEEEEEEEDKSLAAQFIKKIKKMENDKLEGELDRINNEYTAYLRLLVDNLLPEHNYEQDRFLENLEVEHKMLSSFNEKNDPNSPSVKVNNKLSKIREALLNLQQERDETFAYILQFFDNNFMTMEECQDAVDHLFQNKREFCQLVKQLHEISPKICEDILVKDPFDF